MNLLSFLSFTNNPCNNTDVLKTFYFIKELIKLAFIIIPIGSIVILSFDLFKNVISDNENEQKKNLNIFVRRIIFMVVVFLIPTIVKFVGVLVQDSLGITENNYLKCVNVTNATIRRQVNSDKAKCTSTGGTWNDKTEVCSEKTTPSSVVKEIVKDLKERNSLELKYKFDTKNSLNFSNSSSSNSQYPAAEAALKMALPNRSAATGNDGTELYQYIFHSVLGLDNYRSCSEGVATAVRWSGTDDKFPTGPPGGQLKYVRNSSKWVNVEWNGDYSKLQPGDVFLVDYPVHGHSLMYVGTELLHKYFPDAPASYNIVQASYPDQSLCVTENNDLTSSRWIKNAYRCIKPEKNSKYAKISYVKK